MKLLDRSEILKKKNEETRREVEEGVKIAKRVDGLRRLASEEERVHELYRQASVKKLLSDVGDTMNELHDAVGDLKSARQEAVEARKPLDDEWSAVMSRKAEIEAQAQGLQLLITRNTSKQAELEAREDALAEDASRVGDRKEEAERTLRRAADKLASAEEAEKRSKEYAEQLAAMLSERERSVVMREASVLSREIDNDNRAKSLDAREAETLAERRRVSDLYETFMRNKKRDYGTN